jgi:molecular chaperone GrpE
VKVADEQSFFVKKYGFWDFPGGRIDVGEDCKEAFLREVQEETGFLSVKDPETIENIFLEYPEKRTCVIGRLVFLENKDEPILSSEHLEYRWVTAEEVEKGDEYGEMVKRFVASASERLKEREYLNDAKRIYADFENYKRRQEERVKELSTVCAEGFALDMIPVIDNFRAAALHVPEEEKTKAWMTGITYIGKQIEEVLATRGLVAYEAREGEMFDPYLHEAVSHEKGKEEEEGKIVKSLQPGYKMGTRVIRPAKVIFA